MVKLASCLGGPIKSIKAHIFLLLVSLTLFFLSIDFIVFSFSVHMSAKPSIYLFFYSSVCLFVCLFDCFLLCLFHLDHFSEVMGKLVWGNCRWL